MSLCSHETGNRTSVVPGNDTALIRLRSLTIGDVFVHTNSTWVKSFQRATATAKKIETNWKSVYCQITCWALKMAECVKQLPFVSRLHFYLKQISFLPILPVTPIQREDKKTQNQTNQKLHTCSLGTNCLIMKRNLLFLTHFLTLFIPNYKKSNKNNILLDCTVLLYIFSLKVHIIKE